MINLIFPKYGIAPEKIEQKSLDSNVGKYFRDLHDFARLKKVN